MTEAGMRLIDIIYSVGFTLAITVSYAANHHIGWAILHGFSSWLYLGFHSLFG